MVEEKNADNKIIECKHQSNVIAKLLVKALDKYMKLDMANIITYCPTPIPYSIDTTDGFVSKNDNTNSIGNLTKVTENAPNPQSNGLTIKNGNVLFYIITQIPGTFEKI